VKKACKNETAQSRVNEEQRATEEWETDKSEPAEEMGQEAAGGPRAVKACSAIGPSP